MAFLGQNIHKIFLFRSWTMTHGLGKNLENRDFSAYFSLEFKKSEVSDKNTAQSTLLFYINSYFQLNFQLKISKIEILVVFEFQSFFSNLEQKFSPFLHILGNSISEILPDFGVFQNMGFSGDGFNLKLVQIIDIPPSNFKANFRFFKENTTLCVFFC